MAGKKAFWVNNLPFCNFLKGRGGIKKIRA
jgi:hypothetical protein